MSEPSPAIIPTALIRSILQALGMEQVVIDFLVVTAIGALAVFFAILLVGIRSLPKIDAAYATGDHSHCQAGPAPISSPVPHSPTEINSCPIPIPAEPSSKPRP